MYLNGEWVSRDDTQEVLNPYDGSVVDTIPSATIEDVDLAVNSAERGFEEMKKLSAHDRYLKLMKASQLIEERKEDLARTITLEEGKPAQHTPLSLLPAQPAVSVLFPNKLPISPEDPAVAIVIY